MRFATVFSLLLAPVVLGANDWSKACTSGSCTYESGDGQKTAWGTLVINGDGNAISDITSAAGWEILNCDPKSAEAQDIRIVCANPSAGCDHVFQGGAEHTIVRLPENCGAGPFARLSNTWVHEDQSLPDNLQAKTKRWWHPKHPKRAAASADHPVRGMSIDFNFGAIPATKGRVTFSVTGTNNPNQVTHPDDHKRELHYTVRHGSLDLQKRGFFGSFVDKAKSVAKKVAAPVAKVVAPIQKIVAPIEKVAAKVAAPIKKVAAKIAAPVKKVAAKVAAPIKKVAAKVAAPVKKVASKVVSAGKTAAKKVTDATKTAAKKVASAEKTVEKDAKKAVGAVKDGAKKAVGAVESGAKKAVGAVETGAKKAVGAVKEGAEKVVDGAKKGAEKVVDGAKKAAGAVKEGAEKVVDGVEDGTKKAAGAVKEGAEKVVDGVKDGAEKVIDGVEDGAKKVVDGAKKVVGAAGNVIGDAADAVGDATDKVVDGAKKVIGAAGDAIGDANNVDQKFEKDLSIFDVKRNFPILNTSISCPQKGKIPAFDAGINVNVDVDANAHVTMGVAIKGTIVPPAIDDMAITAVLNGGAKATFNVKANAEGTFDTGSIKLFEAGIPGFDFPGIVSVGPTFSINAEASITLGVVADMAVTAAWDLPEVSLVFPPSAGSSGANASPAAAPVKLDVGASADLTGKAEAHLIPRIDLGVNVLNGLGKATVFMDLDAFGVLDFNAKATFNANADTTGKTATSSSFGGCLGLDAGLAITAGLDGSLGPLGGTKSFDLFRKQFDIFDKCFGDQQKRELLPPRDVSLSPRGLNLKCPGTKPGKNTKAVDATATP